MGDILIKNGNVIDGVSKASKKADVLISKGKITDIRRNLSNAKTNAVIDATACFVTPGFIDIQNHADSYLTLLDEPQQRSMLAQGVTTIVVGNCGSSLAPLPSREALKTIQKWHNLSGVNIDWVSFKEFLSTLSKLKLGTNVSSLVGHATLRRGLLSDQVRSASLEEIGVMQNLLSQSLAEGAAGLSLGLVYAHEVDSTIDELLALTKALKSADKYLSVHLRSETTNILEAIDEAIYLASKAEVRVKISHLKVRGEGNWHIFDRVINKLENAYHQGIDIAFDVYPYNSTWTVLYTYLPKWAYEGGRMQILKHLASKMDRRKILDYLKEQKLKFDRLIIASASGSNAFTGKSIGEIAKNQSVSGEEALLDVLNALETQVVVFDHNLSDEHVELLLSSPLSIIASDGAGYSKKTDDLIHPRCFGTMPRFLQMVREKNILTWEQAIKKISFEPARIANLHQKGKLIKGSDADVVVFDPKTIKDLADYNYPDQLPAGINTVIVNGTVAMTEGEFKQSAGSVIRI